MIEKMLDAKNLDDCAILLPKTKIPTRKQAQQLLDRYILPSGQQKNAESIELEAYSVLCGKSMGSVTGCVTEPILCPRLEAKFVRKSPLLRSMRRVQNLEIVGIWRQSLSKSSDWTLTMSKSITSERSMGLYSSFALRVATVLFLTKLCPRASRIPLSTVPVTFS
jgi:hypothetical protein